MLKAELEGMDIARDLGKHLKNLGGNIKGLEFLADKRKESNLTNKEILLFLQEGGRDFVTMSKKNVKAIEKVFHKEVTSRTRGIKIRDGKRFAKLLDKIIVDALQQGVLAMVEIIRQRILRGKTSSGGSAKDLTAAYKVWKLKKYNRIYPIGKATGQLLDNLEAKKRNIKIIK